MGRSDAERDESRTDNKIDVEVQERDGGEKKDVPPLDFLFAVIRFLVQELKVLVLFGAIGLVVGAILGIPLGPGIALTAAAGGIIGFILGGLWEYRRLKSGETYELPSFPQ